MRLYFYGQFRQAEKICDAVIAESLNEGDDPDAMRTRAAAMIAKARVGCEIGLLADNLSLCYQAFGLLDQANDPCLRARALHSLAAAFYYDNKHAPALEYATQSMELCREQNLPNDLVDVLNTVSGLYGSMNDHRSALAFSREALVLARDGEDTTQLIQSLINYAICLTRMSEDAAAEQALGEATNLAEQDQNGFLLATLHCLAGSLKNNQGKFDLGANALQKGLPALEHFETHPRLAAFYYNLGVALWQIGQLEEAEQALMRALEISETFDWQLLMPNIHATLSAYYAHTGDHAKAFYHQSSQVAAQKLAQFSQTRDPFPAPSLKYPPTNPTESVMRSIMMRQARTLDPATNYLNHFTLLASGRQAYRYYAKNKVPTQLLAININQGIDPATLEPRQFGHAELKRITTLLGRHFRITDLPCRMPSGQFLLLMPGTPVATAQTIANNIRAELSNGGEDGGRLDHTIVLASLGAEDRSISHFINRALLALVGAAE